MACACSLMARPIFPQARNEAAVSNSLARFVTARKYRLFQTEVCIGVIGENRLAWR
jgi:hypothetical protein